MRVYYAMAISIVVATLLSILTKNFLSRLNDRIWQIPKLNSYSRYLPYSTLFFLLLWIIGKFGQLPVFVTLGASGIVALIFLNLITIITLPSSWFIDLVSRFINKLKSKKTEKSVNSDRRKFIKFAAASLPVFALGTTGTGLAHAFQPVRINKIPMYFPDLPLELDGFKILHLSDMHLGIYFQLSDLEKLIDNALQEEPDLFLFTGDVSDDLKLLPDALNLVSQLNTPHGGYISLGNHEYYRGIKDAIRIFTKGSVPLLINQGETLKVGKHHLFIGGADDPVSLRSDIVPFLERTVEMTMKSAPPNSFRILMSHRPKTLDVVSNQNIDLILSGHTHGGQVGINGRSLFEGMIEKEPYLWGKYKKGKTQLYTSAGMGHWLPFRLNCPPEAPLITLKRSENLIS